MRGKLWVLAAGVVVTFASGVGFLDEAAGWCLAATLRQA